MLSVTEKDRKIIQDIVTHFPKNERVRTMRSIFKFDLSENHFLYLGELIGAEHTKEQLAQQYRNRLHISNLCYLN